MKKSLSYYMKLDYPILIKKFQEEGKYLYEIEIPDLPGCGAYGENINEVLNSLEEAKEAWIRARLKRGLDIPEPVKEEDFSGRYLLRISPRLHKELTIRAKREGISLNQYIKRILESNITLETILKKIEKLEAEIVRLETLLFYKETTKPQQYSQEEIAQDQPVKRGISVEDVISTESYNITY